MMYAEEILDEYDEDDGTMVNNVDDLRDAVVGHRIVKAEKEPNNRGDYYSDGDIFVITLDNGTRVEMAGGSDCCAYTELNAFFMHPDKIDHIITGVGTTGGYSTWHIYADMGDVLELTVGWSSGNPFYYAYGFDIIVKELS